MKCYMYEINNGKIQYGIDVSFTGPNHQAPTYQLTLLITIDTRVLNKEMLRFSFGSSAKMYPQKRFQTDSKV